MALGTATDAYELRFDAGRICLDLLATTHPVDRLGSVAVLRAWIAGSGLVPAGTELAHADTSWLAGFRELRSRIGQLVPGGLAPEGRPYDLALAHVNESPTGRRYGLPDGKTDKAKNPLYIGGGAAFTPNETDHYEVMTFDGKKLVEVGA
ncbi:hypothetical protein SALBM311S_03042 [Streptomyces alboniger]